MVFFLTFKIMGMIWFFCFAFVRFRKSHIKWSYLLTGRGQRMQNTQAKDFKIKKFLLLLLARLDLDLDRVGLPVRPCLCSQPTSVCQKRGRQSWLAAANGAPWAGRSAAGIKCTLISVQSLVTLIISLVLWLCAETLKQRTRSESRVGCDHIGPGVLTSTDQKMAAAPSLLFWKHQQGGFNK